MSHTTALFLSLRQVCTRLSGFGNRKPSSIIKSRSWYHWYLVLHNNLFYLNVDFRYLNVDLRYLNLDFRYLNLDFRYLNLYLR